MATASAPIGEWRGTVEVVSQGVRVQPDGAAIASIYTPGIVGYEFWKAEALRRARVAR